MDFLLCWVTRLFFCVVPTERLRQCLISLLGEEGSQPVKPFGMSKKQCREHYSKERQQRVAVGKRLEEYTQTKIEKAMDMVKQVIAQGLRFDYLP